MDYFLLELEDLVGELVFVLDFDRNIFFFINGNDGKGRDKKKEMGVIGEV